MTCNFLLLNLDKTEIIALGPTHLRNKLLNDKVNLDHISLTFNSIVRNLRVGFDQDLPFGSNKTKPPDLTSFT